MKKNDILIGECVDYTHSGEGIVKTNDFVFFIKNTIVGEKIEFIVTKIKKNYGYGKLKKVLIASKHRVLPKCPVYEKCGGCQLQHMDYDEQLRFKKKIVENNINNIAKINAKVENCIGMDFKGYRNKAQFPIKVVDEKIKMGFYRSHSNEIIDIDNCLIQSQGINEIFKSIKDLLKKYSFSKQLRHVVIKEAIYNDEIMIVLVSKYKKLRNLDLFIGELVKKHSNIKSIIVNVNNTDTNVILGKDEFTVFGKDMIKEHIHNLDFYISSKSFFQVNPYQSEVLYKKAIELANICNDDVVLDLYCGVGSITLCLAKKAKKVYGVEIVDDAIKNANNNKKINHIDNVEFICQDAKNYSEMLVNEGIEIDVLMIDPPRKGLDSKTIEYINKINPKKIVYISCNSATLARDLSVFSQYNFICDKVIPVDMFLETSHVECIARLEKKDFN